MATRSNYSQDSYFPESADFKILLATDIHLGCYEDNHIRRNDSFEAFEETLKIANEEEVDFVLLGGDLFHDNKPSRPTLTRCMEIIRSHCFGKRNVSIYRLTPSDKEETCLNYENPNLNISLPIFTIHGNHDDPTGPGCLSVIDILSLNGLVNYFGKSSQVDKVEVEPVVLRKGDNIIALYGLGAMRNERLYRTFVQNNVTFLQTEEEAFNLFIIHQNRVKHGEKSFIKPEFIPPFMDLVFWGHEHDNQILPTAVTVGEGAVLITQPGSTVATSLCDGEAGEKNVGILYVRGKKCMIKPRVLKSVRPFLCDEICLEDKVIAHDSARISSYIYAKMDDLLELVRKRFPKNPKLPLIRIKVRVSLPYNQNTVKRDFLSKFSSKVANPEDVLLFSKLPRKSHKFRDGEESMQTEFEDYVTTEDSIVDLFRETTSDEALNILTSDTLSNVLEEFVLKEEPNAMKRYTATTIGRAMVICKSQTTVQPGISDDEMFTHVKRELDSILDEEVSFACSEDYWNADDTKALIDTTSISQMSHLSPTTSRTPVTSPIKRTRGSKKVSVPKSTLPSRGMPKIKRSRSNRDLSQNSDSSLNNRGRKRRKI